MGFRHPIYIVTKLHIFVDNTTNPNSVITFRGYLESESSYGSTLHNYFFVDINDYNKNEITDAFVSNTDDAYIGNNIIARITATSMFNSVIIDNNKDRVFKQRDYLGPVKISKLNIRILNRFGDLIDLNYNDFSMALEMSILYQ